MKFILMTAAALVIAAPASAQSALSGTWKVDEEASKPADKPIVVKLKGASYTCLSCTPSYEVPADGKPHAIKGNPYIDQVAVKIDGPRTVTSTSYRKGQVIAKASRTVSADGKTMTASGASYDNPNRQAVTFNDTFVRTEPGEAGSHAISGAWLAERQKTVEAAGITYTVAVDGDRFRYTTPTGDRLEAVIGGAAAPYAGDPAGMVATVARNGDGLRLTNLVKGEVWSVVDLVPAGNGAEMTVLMENRRNGNKSQMTARKQ